MLFVSINGIMQVPGVDYQSSKNAISFLSPPPAGSTVSIRGKSGVLVNIIGDGSSFLYQFMNDLDHEQIGILEEAFRLRHVPAVADMLEKLEVVVKLAKQS